MNNIIKLAVAIALVTFSAATVSAAPDPGYKCRKGYAKALTKAVVSLAKCTHLEFFADTPEDDFKAAACRLNAIATCTKNMTKVLLRHGPFCYRVYDLADLSTVCELAPTEAVDEVLNGYF
jgi:hypothetical protein